MEVKLSVFELPWVGVTVLSFPQHELSVQDFSTKYENLDAVFIICIEKFIDRLETKIIDLDPSIVGQHVKGMLKFMDLRMCVPNFLIKNPFMKDLIRV